MSALIKRNYHKLGRKQSGFSITEALVVGGIVVILAAAGAPAWRQIIDNNRMDADVLFLRSGLMLARSEAVTRNSDVIICGSTDLTTCGGSLGAGWIVFQDVNADGAFDGGDFVIRVNDHSLDDTKVTLNISDGVSNVLFTGQGRANRAVDFSLCDIDGTVENRMIRVLPTGQIHNSTQNTPVC